MKRIPGMKCKFIAHGFAAIILGCATFVTVASDNSESIVQNSGGVTYMSGGVGDESIELLSSRANEFNLKLVFALGAGEFVSDVRVDIADMNGKRLVDTTSKGPWFFVKLPAGHYQIIATFAGKAVRRYIEIGATKLTTVDFRWASE